MPLIDVLKKFVEENAIELKKQFPVITNIGIAAGKNGQLTINIETNRATDQHRVEITQAMHGHNLPFELLETGDIIPHECK